MLHSLDKDQRGKAVIAEQALAEIRAAGEPNAPDAPPAGLPAKELKDEQVEILWSLLNAYTDKMPTEVGQARIAEVRKAGIEHVYFAWAGADKPGIGHYYRRARSHVRHRVRQYAARCVGQRRQSHSFRLASHGGRLRPVSR